MLEGVCHDDTFAMNARTNRHRSASDSRLRNHRIADIATVSPIDATAMKSSSVRSRKRKVRSSHGTVDISAILTTKSQCGK